MSADEIFHIYNIQSASLPEGVKFTVLKNVFENFPFRSWFAGQGDGDIVITNLRVEDGQSEESRFRNWNYGDITVFLTQNGEAYNMYRMKLIHVVQNMIHRSIWDASSLAPIRAMLLQEIQAQKSNQRDIQNRSLRLGTVDIFRRKDLPDDILNYLNLNRYVQRRRNRIKSKRKASKHTRTRRRRMRSSYKKQR
tara:strand:- start:924 stop:1505 length:582 start_codon:yes stop_codon:yes gene_type:complete